MSLFSSKVLNSEDTFYQRPMSTRTTLPVPCLAPAACLNACNLKDVRIDATLYVAASERMTTLSSDR